MNKGENFKKWEMGKNQKRTKQYKLIKLYKIRFLVFLYIHNRNSLVLILRGN